MSAERANNARVTWKRSAPSWPTPAAKWRRVTPNQPLLPAPRRRRHANNAQPPRSTANGSYCLLPSLKLLRHRSTLESPKAPQFALKLSTTRELPRAAGGTPAQPWEGVWTTGRFHDTATELPGKRPRADTVFLA